MYRARTWIMGCVVRMRKGRTVAICSLFAKTCSWRSPSVWYELSPLSIFLARLLRTRGVYVSRHQTAPATSMTMVAIEVAQEAHRHVVFSATKPPKMGPIDGSRSRAKLWIAPAVPRLSKGKLSPRALTPTWAAECQPGRSRVYEYVRSVLATSGTLSPSPERNRKVISSP